jgi:cellulose synthase/poly-beta-1,6-N-acetylglucosamine synthase-like glycosyltransferase
MTSMQILLALITAYATVWALYLLLFPLVASILEPSVKTLKRFTNAGRPTIATIIPARNAARVIANCICSLHACNYPREQVDIYVVADHCSDDTAQCAQAAGATALIRTAGPPGKTYTLAWALEELTQRGVTPALYLIVDATVQVEANFLTSVAECWQQGEEIITSHQVVSSGNRAWYARCLGLMLVHRNLQNWSRERLGLSALLEGRGMAYSQRYIRRFGWHLALPASSQTLHPTEDFRHAVQAVEQGYRVAFADDAWIYTPLRDSLIEATKQGSRWDRGRMLNAGTHALRLLMRGLWQRDLLKTFAAVDAIQPPVAILGGLSVAMAAIAVFIPVVRFTYIGSFVPLALVLVYGWGVAWRGRREGIGLGTALWAPLYVAWRCATFVLAWVCLDRIGLGRRQKGVG